MEIISYITNKKLMEEIWKDIKGYEGVYKISNTGKVLRLESKIIAPYMKDSGYRTIPSKLLKPQMRKQYQKITLCKDSKVKAYSLHRLIAEAFIPNPNEYPFVLHKDDDPLNNSIDNLMWGTESMNTIQAYQNGRMMGFKKRS